MLKCTKGIISIVDVATDSHFMLVQSINLMILAGFCKKELHYTNNITVRRNDTNE